MTEKINENLAEDDGMLEDEAMLKGVAGGVRSDIPSKACPLCGEMNSGIQVMDIISYNCSNPSHESPYTYYPWS